MPRLIPAVPTPFQWDGPVDEKGLQPLYSWLNGAGVDGVFVCGTTGEFPALDDEERNVVLTEALGVFGPDRVYAHVGAASARQAQRLAARAVALGATRLAAITPYYLPAGPDALLEYYRRIADAAGDAQLFAYLYRDRTTTTVTPEQLAELAAIPSVVGAKISGEPVARVQEYLRAAPQGFEIYSGNDVEFAAVSRVGAAGAVSGVASAFPHTFVALQNALVRGDEKTAAAVQRDVERVVAAVGGNVSAIKYALTLRELPAGRSRMAVDIPSYSQQEVIQAVVDELD